MAKIKVGIFGASGFIGSHLIAGLKNNNNFDIVVFDGNLFNVDDIKTFFDSNKDINQLINLVGVFFGDFEKLFSVNVNTLYNLLSIASEYNIKKVIYLSSGAVYGEPINEKSKEDDELFPNTLYGLSKMYGEECLKYYSRLYSFDFIILRLPNVYGENNNKGVIYNFLDSIKRANKIIILGDGEQKRNFLHVSDATRAIIYSIDFKKGNQTFNIADNEVFSLNDLAHIMKESGLIFKIEYRPADVSNSLQLLSENIYKADKLLNWKPLITLSDGIKNIINHN